MIDRSLFKVTSSLGTVHLFSLAIPMLLESILNNLLGTVSTLVLSGYSEDAVAAVGAANSMLGTYGGFFSVIAFGATVVISNLIGAEKLEKAKEGCFVTILLCTCIGFLSSMALFLYRYPLMKFMNIEGQVLEDAVRYFSVRMFFFCSRRFPLRCPLFCAVMVMRHLLLLAELPPISLIYYSVYLWCTVPSIRL